MYKGQTTIQLFNAETGELEKETHDNNMLTNAITNLLNPPLNLLCGGSMSLNSCYKNIMPMYEKALGGIILFENKREESVNNYRINRSDKIIGHAGSGYSGKSPYRGTLNLNESKALDNGYKWVWDFASDKAVGDIGCVCLTHATGGDAAVYFKDDNLSSSISCGNSATKSSSEYIISHDMTDTGHYQYIKQESSYTYSIKDYRKLNTGSISLFDTCTFSSNDPGMIPTVDPMEAYTTKKFNSSSFSWGNSAYAVKDSIYITRSNGYTRFNLNPKSGVPETDPEGWKVVEEDFETPNLEDSRYVSLRMQQYFAGYYICVGEVKDKIAENEGIFGTPYEIAVYNSDGTYKTHYAGEHFSSNVSLSCHYCIKLDGIRIYNNIYFLSNGEFRVGGLGATGSELDDQSYPYIVSHYIPSSNHNGNIALQIDATYLASINNLATPVTKTNQQTMKITYIVTES